MENGMNAGVLDMVPAAVLHRGGAVASTNMPPTNAQVDMSRAKAPKVNRETGACVRLCFPRLRFPI